MTGLYRHVGQFQPCGFGVSLQLLVKQEEGERPLGRHEYKAQVHSQKEGVAALSTVVCGF